MITDLLPVSAADRLAIAAGAVLLTAHAVRVLTRARDQFREGEITKRTLRLLVAGAAAEIALVPVLILVVGRFGYFAGIALAFLAMALGMWLEDEVAHARFGSASRPPPKS